MSDIQQRLLAVRKELGLTQPELGKVLGLSERAYKNYELGIRELPLAVALKLSENFKISIAWLLVGDGAPTTPSTGEALEAAVIAAREHFIETNKSPTPQQEAAIIRYIYEEIIREGKLNIDRVSAYLRTL